MNISNPCYDFIAIDFETANHDLVSACSIGIVAVKGLHIVDEFHEYICPANGYFEESNSRIHGITENKVSNCSDFYNLWPRIKGFFQCEMVVAHNAHFDMSVLKNCLNYYTLPYTDFIYMDSIAISSLAIDKFDYIGPSLLDRSRHFNISLDAHHDALCDARASAQLVIETLRRLNLPSLLWLVALNNINAKQFNLLTPQKSMYKNQKKRNWNHVKPSDLICKTSSFDTDNPFFGKNCVLTGELNTLARTDAMQKIIDLGGIIKTSVSLKTDYLIVGVQDNSIVGDDGMSTKEEKAYELIEKGHKIEIIDEKTLLDMLLK